MRSDRRFGFSSLPPKHFMVFGAAALASPVITLAILELNYALAEPVCRGSLSPLVIHAIKLLTIAGLAGIALYGRRYLNREEPLDSDGEESVASFTAFVLITLTALCILIVITQWIAVFAVPCTY